MQIASFYGWGHFCVAAAYLAVAYRCWTALQDGRGVRPAPLTVAMLLAAVLGHGLLLAQDMFGSGGLRFGFAQALSATYLVACLLLWAEGFFVALGALYALMTPMAAVAMLLPLAFHGVALAGEGSSLALRIHLGVAMLAYSLFTVAAIQSVLMAATDRYLHEPMALASRRFGPLLAQMPPLLTLEKFLFRQLAVGFVLLSATLVSGIAFTEELFGRPLRFNHMTLFGVISWVVFAVLLVGRYAFGWRGKVAQRWLFVGLLTLLLAYIGTRFVYEVVLDRAWVR